MLKVQERTNYPVSLSIDDYGDGFGLTAQTVNGVEAERICMYMMKVLEGLVETLGREPKALVRSIEVLPEAERRQLLEEWNETTCEYPREKLVHELFEEQVGKTPEAIAVVFEDDMLSYRELNLQSNQLAHYLRRLGVGSDERVAICAKRGIEMTIGLLGALKSGGTYVPLDPTYPTERLYYMLEDSRPAVVLTQGNSDAAFSGIGEKFLALNFSEVTTQWQQEPDINPVWNKTEGNSKHLAYIIYTSGSTGVPKGVMVEHRGLSNYVAHAVRTYLGEEIVGSVVSSPLSFDATLTSLLPPLVAGKTVELLLDDDTTLSCLADRLFEGETGGLLFKITPSHLEALEYMERPRAVGMASHLIVLGGEQLGVKQLRRWKQELLPNARFVNEYGPTETVVGCSVWVLEDEAGLQELEGMVNVPIGRPIGNAQLYVLGGGEQLQPVNSVGELYIGGEGVGRGYWNRAELTAERFTVDQFGSQTGGRLYRTGDMARRGRNQNLEFLGRIDNQIKIRGYRIELEEIEARLAEHEWIREAAVIVRENTVSDQRLVAYYTNKETNGEKKGEIDADLLRTHLLARLPEYMVPTAYVYLESMPLTPNGKLDRRRLPEPGDDAYTREGYEEPQGEIEMILAGIWSELLGVERVGRWDNFFKLGGHSLLALSMIERMRRKKLYAEVQNLFVNPTLAELAESTDKIKEIIL
jgi:amino acid adenylation domain-containing protein